MSDPCPNPVPALVAAFNREGCPAVTAARTTVGLAVAGGVVWALTPLRDAIHPATGAPGSTSYRIYDLVVTVAVACLAAALLLTRGAPTAAAPRTGAVGRAVVLLGLAVLAGTGLLSLLGASGDLLTASGDVGFLAALVATAGGIPLGIALVRSAVAPPAAGLLFALGLPVGMAALVGLTAAGYEGIAGLGLTTVYGAGWALLGLAGVADRAAGTRPIEGRFRVGRSTT